MSEQEKRLERLFEQMLDRLVATGRWELLARMAVALPFLVPAWSWIDLPVMRGGSRRVPVENLAGSAACMHELLMIFEELGEQELYRDYERWVLAMQREEAKQVECLVAVMEGKKEAEALLQERYRAMVLGSE
ncbi:hypothetical protein KTAU_13820 [Thermogemmatispora aurantia]|uniref:Uncharacterized protein n=2 Tax=Thermogemmatispora aurantia TaxID=2045279 RepID=A0A5J4K5D8_9CHLR|nr:hypothetical protein KTAU_13820 [Thermogemmatispora aurantia]